LAATGAELLVETLNRLQAGKIDPRPQNHSQASLAPILKKENGEMDFHLTATEIYNRLRGFQPWPGAFTGFRGKNLNVWAAKPVPYAAVRGELRVEGNRLIVGCGEGTALELLEVQPEGKKRIAVLDFIHGYRPRNGEQLVGTARTDT